MIMYIVQGISIVTTLINNPLTKYASKKYKIYKSNKHNAKEYENMQIRQIDINYDEYDMLTSVLIEKDGL